MKVATWNINGVKARLETVLTWLQQASPDVVCLQEIKSIDENFPSERFEELGYNVATHGQKSFNGVAVLAKSPFDDVQQGLPGDDGDEQARYLEVCLSTASGSLRVASIYLPNGNPVDTEKYPYKLRWMERLRAHAKLLLAYEEPLVLAGDYNVIPTAVDAKRPELWVDDALYRLEIRKSFKALMALGLTDAFRAVNTGKEQFTFWDYQAGAWQKNNGIRIDHLLLSPQAADLLTDCRIDKEVRAWEKPSDHVPIWAEFSI